MYIYFWYILLSRAPTIEVNVEKQLRNTLAESLMTTGVEMWGLKDGWKEQKKIRELFCKRVIGIPGKTARGLGRTK